MRYLQYLPILVLLMFVACSEEVVEFEHFFDRDAQTVSERTVTALPSAEAVLNFTDYEIYSPGTLNHNSTHLFLIDFGTLSIATVSKEMFENPDVIEFSEGRGPGELLSMQSLAVSDDRLMIGDPRQMRIVETDTDGLHLQDVTPEFSPDNLFYMGDRQLLNYNAHQQDHLFTLFDMDADSTWGFEEITFGFSEVMKYPGYLYNDGENIFYAGYSEPILRKYTTDGTLFFSRSTVDNYDTENNYIERTMGENRMVGLSEDAKVSSMDVAYYDGTLLVIPFHHGDEDVKYIDLYDASTGDYLKTLSAEYHPRKLSINDEYLYILAGDDGDHLLLRYSNPLN
jgi:hypothetical protein